MRFDIYGRAYAEKRIVRNTKYKLIFSGNKRTSKVLHISGNELERIIFEAVEKNQSFIKK